MHGNKMYTHEIDQFGILLLNARRDYIVQHGVGEPAAETGRVVGLLHCFLLECRKLWLLGGDIEHGDERLVNFPMTVEEIDQQGVVLRERFRCRPSPGDS